MLQPSAENPAAKENSGLILLVEDNLVNQKVAMVLLERLGLAVEIANNGKEAVTAVSKQKFSIILMDCQMPEMDGFQATTAIRKLEALSGHYTPIIAVTALAMVGDKERCIAVGMDDYISKPIDKDLLKIKLQHWLRTDVVYRSQKLARKLMLPQSDVMGETPINLDELEEFYGSEQLTEMLTLFIVQTEDMIRRVKFFIKERNVSAVAGLAHELRASCASLGAKQLARPCLYLEQSVGQLDWPEVEDTISSLQKSFERFKRFLQPIIATNPAVK